MNGMSPEQQVRREIAEVGRWLYEKRFVAATEGNISVRLGQRVLITPSGRCKGMLRPEEIVGTDLEGINDAGGLSPSSELLMHLAIYRRRPGVGAVIHAHPPHATGFAVAGIALDKPVLPEVVFFIGTVPLVAYATPGSREAADSVGSLIDSHDALLLSNHGAVTCGANLQAAYFKMETLEQFAWISTIARFLGNERELTPEQVARIEALK